MPVKDVHFYETSDDKFGVRGVALNKYNDEYSLVVCEEGKDKQVYMAYMFPQEYKDGKWIPKQKAIPAGTPRMPRDTMVLMLRFFLGLLGERVDTVPSPASGVEQRLPGHKHDIEDDDIPF